MLTLLGLSAGDEAAYRALLRTPDLGTAGLAARLDLPEDDVEALLRRLSRQGLVRRSRGAWRPVRPDKAIAPVVAQQQAELDLRRAQLEEARHAVTGLLEDYLSGRRPGGDLEIEVVEGLPAIRARIDQLIAGTHTELLTVSTHEEMDEEGVDAQRAQDVVLAERGVRVRTVSPPQVRNGPRLWAYMAECAARGEEFRLVNPLPPRMIVCDRQVAVLPVDPSDPDRGVHVVWSAALVAALVALFEALWPTGTPVFAPPAQPHRHDPRLLSLLAAGAKDETIARNLGKGLRTVRREVADLLTDLRATTRFEAGVAAARRGWL